MKFILPLAALLIMLLVWQVSVISTPSVSEGPYQELTVNPDSLKAQLFAAGIEWDSIDGLVEELRPKLLAPTEERKLEYWYANRSLWKDQFIEPEQVINAAELIFATYLEEDQLTRAAKVKTCIGRIYNIDGDFDQAIEAHQIAYTLAQEVNDSTAMGWSFSFLGSCFGRKRDLVAALDYGYRTLDFGLKLENQGIEAAGLMIVGGVKGYRNELDSALYLMNRAVELAGENEYTDLKATGVSNVILLYNKLALFDTSIVYANEQLNFAELGLAPINAFLHLNLGMAYMGIGDFTQADRYFTIGCEMADRLEYVYGQMGCSAMKTDFYQKQGLLTEALAASGETQNFLHKIAGDQQNRAIRSLELLRKDLEIEKLNKARQDSKYDFQKKLRSFILFTLLILLLVPAIYLFFRNQNRAELAEQQKRMAETKLQMLQSQMHPHFVFNALGGIQNYILKSEKIDAYNYMGKFATLLRTMARTSTQVHIDLKQEIKFIESYLEMEKLRFRDDFFYTLEVAPALRELKVLIPSMIIQPAVENALVHGLVGLDYPGNLKVEIKHCDRRETGVCCIVTDNGRGRKAALEIAQHENKNGHLSIATVNTSKRIDFLRSLGYTEIEANIEDLYENGQAAGTRVSIFLPYLPDEPRAFA